MTEFDNIIIGAGPGGYELAAELASRGESVAVMENRHVGGTCLNRGCIPTKCLCATAEAVEEARHASMFGVNLIIESIDYKAAKSRMETVVGTLRSAIDSLLKGCTVIHGTATLMPDNRVECAGEVYKAIKRIVIATGSVPSALPIEGAELAISSDEALALDELPDSIAIIGGGVIGLEFASIFNSLGVKVTVIEYCKEVLPNLDAELAKRLRTALSRQGIEFAVGAKVEKIERNSHFLTVVYQGKRGEATVDASTVLMAVGRKPLVPSGADTAGVELTPRGFIAVDEYMRTSAPGIYALGDVNGLSMLAHSASAQGRVVAFDNPALFNADAVPSVVFTTPELACVGPTSAALDARGVSYHTIKRPYGASGKALAAGQEQGIVKMLIGEDDTILGISILGAHAADLIAEATILVTDHVKASEVAKRYIHAHPTLSELFC